MVRLKSWGFASLRGAILKEYRVDGIREQTIANKSHYQTVLEETFGLPGDLADNLWPGVQQRHRQWQLASQEQNGDTHAR